MNVPKRRGLVLTVIGPILMLVLAPAALGIGIWRGVVASNDLIDRYAWTAAGQTVEIDSVAPQSIVMSDTGDASSVDCAIDGPAGQIGAQPVPYDEGPIGASSYLEVEYFDPDSPGTYQIDCDAGRVKVMPTQVLVDADDASRVPFLVGLGVGGVLFAVGVALLVVGIVKLVRSSRERQVARLAQAGYGYGPSYGSPFGVPPAPYGGQYPAPPAPYRGSHPQQPPTMGDPNDPYAPPPEKRP